jgi:hypothetical protein
MSTPRDHEERVERARAVRIEDEIARRGIKLKKSAKSEREGPCPICGGKDRFSINTAKQVFNCRQCGKAGDIIDMVMALDGSAFNDAVETLTGSKPNGRGRHNGSRRTNAGASSGTKKVTVATYDYANEAGEIVFSVVRTGFQKPDGTLDLDSRGKPKKSFAQRRPHPDNPQIWVWGLTAGDYIRKARGAHWFAFEEERWASFPAATRERRTIEQGVSQFPPYRLPELLEAVAGERRIFIVEGEAKVDCLATWNIAATCNAAGAGKWTADHAKHLRGADVVILPDNDDKGRQHAETVARTLQGIAARVRILELPGLPDKGDIIDWAAAGHTREELDALVEKAPEWRPTQEEETGQGSPLDEMLGKFSIVLVGGSARILTWKKRQLYDGGDHDVATLLTAADFKLYHQDKFEIVKGPNGKACRQQIASLFLDQAKRYDDLVFMPGAGPIVGKAMNLWRGFGITPKQGRWPLLRAHMRDVMAAGIEKNDLYNFQWMAWTYQNPGRQAEVALVFRGLKGTGKGTLGNAMCRTFGPHGLQISNGKHLVGTFNMHMSQCAFLFADEAYWPGAKEGEGALKRLITEPTLTIEPKGVDLFAVANRLHVMIAGNDPWLVPASGDERRFAVNDVSDHRRGDQAYFQALYAEMNNGGLAAMLYDMLAFDLKGWHPRYDVPQSDALQRQKAMSRRGVDALIEIVATEGSVPCSHLLYHDVAVTTGEGAGKGFYAHAKNLVPDLRFVSSTIIATTLVEQWGCERWKSGNDRGLRFPTLAKLREAFDAKHGPQLWAAPEIWEENSTT